MPISNLYMILVVDDNQNNLFTSKSSYTRVYKGQCCTCRYSYKSAARVYKDASEDESIATGLITTKFARG